MLPRLLSILFFVIAVAIVCSQLNYFLLKPFFLFPSLMEIIRSWTGVLILTMGVVFIFSASSTSKKTKTLKILLLVLLSFYYLRRTTLYNHNDLTSTFQLSEITPQKMYTYPDSYSFQHFIVTKADKILHIIRIISDDEISDENIWKSYRTVRRAGAFVRHKENALIISDIKFLSYDSQPYRILSEVSRAKRRKVSLFEIPSIFSSFKKNTLIFSKGIPCFYDADIVTCEDTNTYEDPTRRNF